MKKGPRTVGAVQRAERKITMKHYSIKDWLLTALAAIIVLAALALGWLNWEQDQRIRRETWENSVPFANQHIEWTGAGYQRIGGDVND